MDVIKTEDGKQIPVCAISRRPSFTREASCSQPKTVFGDGEPCDHRGCERHLTHQCEGCGRIAARGKAEKLSFM